MTRYALPSSWNPMQYIYYIHIYKYITLRKLAISISILPTLSEQWVGPVFRFLFRHGLSSPSVEVRQKWRVDWLVDQIKDRLASISRIFLIFSCTIVVHYSVPKYWTQILCSWNPISYFLTFQSWLFILILRPKLTSIFPPSFSSSFFPSLFESLLLCIFFFPSASQTENLWANMRTIRVPQYHSYPGKSKNNNVPTPNIYQFFLAPNIIIFFGTKYNQFITKNIKYTKMIWTF